MAISNPTKYVSVRRLSQFLTNLSSLFYTKPSTGIPKTDLDSAVQTSLGKADSSLQSHQTITQDRISGATVNRYGACSTAAATAAKTVSVTNGTVTLSSGLTVRVKFANANTANSPTLNVNSKGAKNIFHNGSQITTGANKALLAGICEFCYDGTQWHLVGNYIDTDTTYESKAASSGGTAVSLCTTGEKYTWNNKGSYSKPSGGIPKTDLASAVQTSLDKADTALQSADMSAYATVNSLKSKGGTTQPIYFDANGAPQNTTYTLGKSVPSDAVFTDTTYTPAKLGFGYGTCATAAATTAKTVTLSNYVLTTGGYISVKFTYAVPASATLNVNSKGAKSIYYKGSAITAGVIKAGDMATFVYDGSKYHLVSIDVSIDILNALRDANLITKS